MHQLGHGALLELHKFLTSMNKATEFEKLTNKFISNLITFWLDWCKLKLYSKWQWFSENTCGISRLIPYFYANFILNADLFYRDVMIENAFKLLQKLLNSLCVMMSTLLRAEERSKTRIDLSTRIFLTSTHNFFEIYSQEKSKNDFWIKGNFASLLNLPSQIENFVPLRLYCNGNNELFFRYPKMQLRI